MQPRNTLWCLIPLCSGIGMTYAAEEETVLKPFVVTAAGYEQEIASAPASISIITRQQLEKKPFMNLEDAVRDVEGVSVVGTDPNGEDISIRGMPGEYTLILVDGKRQGTRETMNRATSGVQASMVPPLAAIERIEVVRGPMSSLYGSDAMGGVINIITRKHPETWGGSLTLGHTSPDASRYGATTSSSVWVGGPVVEGLASLQFYGGRSDRDEDDIYYAANLTPGSGDTKDDNYNVKLTLTPTTTQDITLNAGRNTLDYRNTPGKTVAASADMERTRHIRDNWSIAHDGRWSFGDSTVSLSQEKEKMTDWYAGSIMRPELTNTYLDGQLNLPLASHLLTVGGQWTKAKVEGVSDQDNISGYTNTDEIERKSYALFIEDAYALNDRLTLTAGLRLDHYDDFGSHVTPRLYANYKLSDTWSLRAGVAQGFKAPTLRQSTASYCMSTGGGSLPRGPLCGNPNLDPEESTTEEIGIRYDAASGLAFGMTLFNNDFKHKVVSYDSGLTDPADPTRPLYVYGNIDKVRIRGVEMTGAVPISARLKFTANYTYTDSERRGGGEPAFDGSSLDGKPLDKTPEHIANARFDWQVAQQLSAYTSANYLGKQYYTGFRNGAVKSREREPSATMDVGLTWTVTKSLNLSAAVLNLTDRIVAVDDRGRFDGLDGNWMVDEGRRYWVSATYSF